MIIASFNVAARRSKVGSRLAQNITRHMLAAKKTHKDELFVPISHPTAGIGPQKFIHAETQENTHFGMNELWENPKVHSWPNPQKHRKIQ